MITTEFQVLFREDHPRVLTWFGEGAFANLFQEGRNPAGDSNTGLPAVSAERPLAIALQEGGAVCLPPSLPEVERIGFIEYLSVLQSALPVVESPDAEFRYHISPRSFRGRCRRPG